MAAPFPEHLSFEEVMHGEALDFMHTIMPELKTAFKGLLSELDRIRHEVPGELLVGQSNERLFSLYPEGRMRRVWLGTVASGIFGTRSPRIIINDLYAADFDGGEALTIQDFVLSTRRGTIGFQKTDSSRQFREDWPEDSGRGPVLKVEQKDGIQTMRRKPPGPSYHIPKPPSRKEVTGNPDLGMEQLETVQALGTVLILLNHVNFDDDVVIK